MSRLGGRDGVLVGALCLIVLLVLLPYYSYNAMLLLIQREWGMSSGEAGFVFGATQIGYIIAVLFLLPLTDRTGTAYVILGSTILSVVGNVLFALLADGVVTGSLFRALAGAGLGGTYMPGMRLISERFTGERRGTPIGVYIAAFVGGAAFSLGGTALLVPYLGWRGAYLAVSLAGLGSVAVAAAMTRVEKPRERKGARGGRARAGLADVLRSKPILLVTAAYTGHVWELFGMRSWLPPFLATILVRAGSDTTWASAQGALVASVAALMGAASSLVAGVLSDRIGRTTTTAVVLGCSAACSFTIGWLASAPFRVVVILAMVYGLSINSDSPAISAALTEVAPPSRLGAAMAFQTTSGWATGIVAPTVLGMVLDAVPGDAGWGLAFGSLGVGAVLALAATLALRRLPEGKLMAGGRG